MTARILAAVLLLTLGVGVRAQGCSTPGDIFINGECRPINTIIEQRPAIDPGAIQGPINVFCPAGYEMVWRSNLHYGCAKGVIDAK